MVHDAAMPQNPPTDEITTKEALVILGYTNPSTITRYVQSRKIAPSRKLPGKNGAYLFWRADVLRLAAQQDAERVAGERAARRNGGDAA